MNVCILQGRLHAAARAPGGRRRPLGGHLRARRRPPGRAGPSPSPWSGTMRRRGRCDLDVDAEVVVAGRVRRRWFRSGGATQSRTEVVAVEVLPARSTKRVAKLVGDALGRRRPGRLDRTSGRARQGPQVTPGRALREDGPMNQEQRGQGPGRAGVRRRPRPERRQHAEGASHSTGSPTTPGRATTRCSPGCTRCAPASSPAAPSTATGSSAPSSSRGRWTAQIEGRGSAEYLWDVKRVVPFLKVDKGLADEAERRPAHEAHAGPRRAARASGGARASSARRCARSIKLADEGGIKAIVDQQFEVGRADPGGRARPDPRARGRHPQPGEGPGRGPPQGGRPRAPGPPRRPAGDVQAHAAGRGRLLRRPRRPPQRPEGGRPVGRLQPGRGQRPPRPQPGVVASFSRALTEGLSAEQSDEEFDAALDATIQSIYDASVT